MRVIHVTIDIYLFTYITDSFANYQLQQYSMGSTKTEEANMEITLEAVMSAIQQIGKRLDSIEDKFDKFDLQLQVIETKYEEKYTELENKIETLDDKIKSVCNGTAMVESTMTAHRESLDDCLNQIDFLVKENLLRESYSKRLNILIHGIAETDQPTNETKLQTNYLIFAH